MTVKRDRFCLKHALVDVTDTLSITENRAARYDLASSAHHPCARDGVRDATVVDVVQGGQVCHRRYDFRLTGNSDVL